MGNKGHEKEKLYIIPLSKGPRLKGTHAGAHTHILTHTHTHTHTHSHTHTHTHTLTHSHTLTHTHSHTHARTQAVPDLPSWGCSAPRPRAPSAPSSPPPPGASQPGSSSWLHAPWCSLCFQGLSGRKDGQTSAPMSLSIKSFC